MKNILILGASGLIGIALSGKLMSNSNLRVYGTYNSKVCSTLDKSYQLSVDDKNKLIEILEDIKPDVVVSSLRGNFNDQLDLHIALIHWIHKENAKLIFLSTANVFDGDQSVRHIESDKGFAISDYGQYKLKCEDLILESLKEKATIVRLPMIWGKNSPRLKEIRTALENDEPFTVYPQLSINTMTDDILAKQIEYIIENNLSGKIHFGARDEIGFKEFYDTLTAQLSSKSLNYIEEYEMSGSFSLDSTRRGEFPIEFNYSNNDVIDYLVTN